MIVLHVAPFRTHLALWGETPPSPSRRSRRKRSEPRPSPFDAGADALFEALSQVGIDAKSRKNLSSETVFAWLPSLPDGPWPSSPLISDRPLNGVPPSLKPWLVSASPLPSEAAVLLLSSAAGRRTLATGVVVGSTLAYWSQVLRFASALVARQQFLPGIRVDEDGYLACWEPVISGVDSHTFSCLARTMPPACRALSEDSSQAPVSPSSQILQETLDHLVDHLVRSSGTGVDSVSG
ncbi:MAG TPA: ATP-dependent helicase, partial [Isosphaeraceae bacterium]|nr:ATP-dependent helicase [Isosphaeraceae bacterium]